MGKRGETWKSKVLEILRRRSEPLSAYDILGELSETFAKVSPPTVYRALTNLKAEGHVHRLESMNAYIACQCAGHQHPAVLSICDDCGAVEEKIAPELLLQISSIVEETGFSAQRHVIEVHGTCGSCGQGQRLT